MKDEKLSDDRRALDALFIRNCKEYNAGLNCVNPYVGNMTVYGISAIRAKALLTANGVFHPTYNPQKDS